MAPHSASPTQGQRTAISADRIFDGYLWHDNAVVLIRQGLIEGIAARGEIDAGTPMEATPPGTLLAPGFIDLQVNGGGGILLNDDPSPQAMRAIARAHRRTGTTACLPTLITDHRSKAVAAIAAAKSAAGSDGILGLHLEGPFISPARPGIHRSDYIMAAAARDLDWLGQLSEAGSSLVTLAPECVPDGFIKTLARSGIRVSVGHSEASGDAVSAAIDDGLSGVTHLFNAMPAMSARAPGIVGVALADARLTAGIILDGVHVDPLVARAAFAAKAPGTIALVSDAMPTVGTELDRFELMGRQIHLRGGRLVSDEGTLAGAHLDLASAVRNAVTLVGLSLDDALRAASLVPARFLGLDRERGTLGAGARADIVALTPDLDVVTTWLAGERE